MDKKDSPSRMTITGEPKDEMAPHYVIARSLTVASQALIHQPPEEVAAGINEIEMVDGKAVKVKGGKDVRAALDMILKNRNWYQEHQASGKGEVHIHITGKDEQL